MCREEGLRETRESSVALSLRVPSPFPASVTLTSSSGKMRGCSGCWLWEAVRTEDPLLVSAS